MNIHIDEKKLPDHMDVISIGIIHSSYKERGDAPRQGRLGMAESRIVIEERFLPGLREIEKCSHIFVLYWLDRADRSLLEATPPGTTGSKGVFATRSPHRPNPIGLGIANLVKVEGKTLTVRGLDAFDGTPVLDIKPYSRLDSVPEASIGWAERDYVLNTGEAD